MAAGPLHEGFAGGAPVAVGDEDFFHEGGQFVGADAAEDLAGDALLVVHAATEHEMVTLAAVGELRAHAADIAAVVLGAGIRAAGEVDVDGEVKAGVALAKVGHECAGVALGVGGGVLAAFVSRAGDDAAGGSVRLGEEAEALHGPHERGGVGVGHVRDDEALPHGEAQRALAVVVGEVGDPAHLLRVHAADGHTDPDVVQAGLGLLVDAEVAVLDDRVARLGAVARRVDQREGEFLLGLLEEAREAAPFFEQVLEAGLLAVGAVAVLAEDADHGGGDRDEFGRLEQHAGVAGEILVAADAADLAAEVDAGRDWGLGFGIWGLG